jgi:hypothetical protein
VSLWARSDSPPQFALPQDNYVRRWLAWPAACEAAGVGDLRVAWLRVAFLPDPRYELDLYRLGHGSTCMWTSITSELHGGADREAADAIDAALARTPVPVGFLPGRRLRGS